MKKLIPFIAAIVMILSSCSKAEEFVYIDDEMDEEVLTPITVSDESGNETVLNSGTTVGVYIIDENGEVTLQQVEVDENGNAILPASDQGSTMVAYAPYQEDWGEDAVVERPIFTVSEDQSDQEGLQASDLMMGTITTSAKTRARQTATFKHMMAKIAIYVVDETGQADMSKMGVKLMDVSTSVSVDLIHVTTTTIDNMRTDIEMNAEQSTDWRLSALAIVAPQTLKEGKTLYTVNIQGNKLRFPAPQAIQLESGKTYTISMRLTDEGLIPDGNYVTDWDDEGENPLIL